MPISRRTDQHPDKAGTAKLSRKRTKRTPHNLAGKAWKEESRRHLVRPSLLLGEIEPIVTQNPKAQELRQADSEKPKRESTGDMLFIRDREKYELIVSRLAQNESTCAIHRETGTDRTVIEAIRAREGVTIEKERAYILDKIRQGARLYSERLVDLALTSEKMRPRDITIALGVLTDKMLLLSGEATSISQQTVSHTITHTAFNDILDAIELKPANGREIVSDVSESQDSQLLTNGQETGIAAQETPIVLENKRTASESSSKTAL